MTIERLAPVVLALASLACSSSVAGGATGDAGAADRDPPSGPDAAGAADGPAEASDDAPPEAAEAADPAACVSDAGAPKAGDFANVPSCTPGTCALAGSLDGATFSQSYPVVAFTYANGVAFQTDFGTAGHLDMTAPTELISGGTETAAGSLRMPAEGPRAGVTLCVGNGSRLQYVDDAGHIQIRFIVRCMDTSCGAAGAAPVAGEIDACCER
jgi:hypothetical protein